MKKTLVVTILSLSLSFTSAFAAKECTVQIPSDCEIRNTVYSAASSDDVHSLQIDCVRQDGTYETLIAKASLKLSWLGVGRNVMPSKITYVRANRDNARMTCR